MGFMGFGNSYTKEGKGISREDVQKRRFIIFFEVIGRKFWKLCQLSLIYTLVSLPALAIYFAASTLVVPSILALAIGQEAVAGMAGYLVLYTLIFAAFLLLMLGSGPVSCGAYYVVRNFSREEHSWVISDFFEHLRKNLKQGMVVFVINILIVAALLMNIMFYSTGMAEGIPEAVRLMLITAVCVLSGIYAVMQMYIYPMMVTFELKVADILKNALLFAIYKLPQNVLMLALTVFAFFGMVFLGELLPVFYLFIPALGVALIMLGQTFYTFSVISKAMIKEEDNTAEEIGE